MADDRTILTCEYTYSDELIETLARLRASSRRRGVLLLCGCVLVAAGSLWLFEPQPLHWLGLAPIALGLYCIWFRSNTWRAVARAEQRRMREGGPGAPGRWRRVEVDDEGMTVLVRDGRSQRYRFSGLTDFERAEGVYIAVFGRNSVALPVSGFPRGASDAAALGDLLARKRYPSGSMGPDTPNR